MKYIYTQSGHLDSLHIRQHRRGGIYGDARDMVRTLKLRSTIP